MAEPATTTAAGVGIAAVAAIILEVTGVDLPPLVWSLIGAAFGQAYSNATVGRWRAMAQVLLGGMLGAILGLGGAHLGGIAHTHAVLLLCALGGVGTHPIVNAAVSAVVRKIEKV